MCVSCLYEQIWSSFDLLFGVILIMRHTKRATMKLRYLCKSFSHWKLRTVRNCKFANCFEIVWKQRDGVTVWKMQHLFTRRYQDVADKSVSDTARGHCGRDQTGNRWPDRVPARAAAFITYHNGTRGTSFTTRPTVHLLYWEAVSSILVVGRWS